MSFYKEKVLVASDNPDFLSEHLSDLKKDCELQMANTTEMTMFLAKEWEPRICVFDADSSLMSVIGEVYKRIPFSQLGTIAVARKASIFQEEKAFRAGADYFLPYPDDYRRLKMRLQALSRRMNVTTESTTTLSSNEKMSSYLEFGSIQVFPQDYIVKYQGERITATPTQFKLLLVFISYKDQLLSRPSIRKLVWDNARISTRSIDAQISKLKKLIPELDHYLVNIYGKGYILTESQKTVA